MKSNLPTHGKIPPQAKDVEEAVLGAAMSEADGLRNLMATIKSADVFYDPAHQLIFRGMLELYQQGKAVDIVTITQQLRKTGHLEQAGGAYRITTISNRVCSSANILQHTAILLEKYTLRSISAASAQLYELAYNDTTDPFELLGTAQQHLNAISEKLTIKRPSLVPELLPKAMQKIADTTKSKGLTGVPSGFVSLDKVTGGWQPSDLIILAARPAMGKTTLALNFARNAAVDFQKPVLVVSLEMNEMQLTTKLISSETSFTTNELTKGTFAGGLDAMGTIHEKCQPLMSVPIVIDDTPAISITQLRATASRLKAEQGIQLIIVDYLQLMRGDGSKGSREQEISSISRGLKLIAKELNIPVIALSQLNRSVESRSDKRPMLSDLRESGAIEQDADMIMFVYRPEYYSITEDSMGNPTAGTADIIIAKHRNGPVLDVPLGCKINIGKFHDLEWSPAPATTAKQLSSVPEYSYTELPPSDFEDEENRPF